jgi:hypothetical protein
MSLFGRAWGTLSYAFGGPPGGAGGAAKPHPNADANPYTARLGDVTVEAVRTFNSLLNTFSKTFDFRYDEAMRVDPQFALKMRRDPYLRSLLQERLTPLTRWNWSLKPEDPDHKSQAERAKWYEAAVRRTPKLKKMLLYLGHAAWYGRHGAQLAFRKRAVAGKTGWVVKKHYPVNGDKLVYHWDDTPGVRINAQSVRDYPREDVTYDSRGTPILFLRKEEFRRKFVIHVHELDDADYFEPEMAGRVHGIGLRDFCYYGAYLRSEMIRWAVAFMEKVGTLGLLIFYYPEGNDAARKQAELSAREANNRNALAIPVPKGGDKKTSGTELMPANMTGVQFLVDIISGWWEKHVERLFVGQTLSSDSEGSGLGGTGVAALHADTKFNLLQFDADGLAETLTEDFVSVLCDLNGDAGWGLAWEFALPDPAAKDKLDAVTKAATIPGKKLTYKASELRDLIGFSKPGPDDEVVGGDEEKPGQQSGPDGQPVPGAGGAAQPQVPPGNPPQPGQPQPPPSGVNPDATPAADADNPAAADAQDSEGAGDGGAAQPHPEAEALLWAMTRAALKGDHAALDDLAELADDPEGLSALASDLHGEEGGDAGGSAAPAPAPAQPPTVNYWGHPVTLPYGWSAAQTRNGKVKAVGNGPHQGKTLYGKKAQAALNARQKQAAAKPPTKKQQAARAAAGRRQAAQAATTAARSAVQRATTAPASLTGADLAALSTHLRTLSVADLKSFARVVKLKVSGVKRDLGNRILGHFLAQHAAAHPPAPPAPAGPTAPPVATPAKQTKAQRQQAAQQTVAGLAAKHASGQALTAADQAQLGPALLAMTNAQIAAVAPRFGAFTHGTTKAFAVRRILSWVAARAQFYGPGPAGGTSPPPPTPAPTPASPPPPPPPPPPAPASPPPAPTPAGGTAQPQVGPAGQTGAAPAKPGFWSRLLGGSKPAAPPAPAAPGSPPSPLYTGVDANGHHWVNGRQVAKPPDETHWETGKPEPGVAERHPLRAGAAQVLGEGQGRGRGRAAAGTPRQPRRRPHPGARRACLDRPANQPVRQPQAHAARRRRGAGAYQPAERAQGGVGGDRPAGGDHRLRGRLRGQQQRQQRPAVHRPARRRRALGRQGRELHRQQQDRQPGGRERDGNPGHARAGRPAPAPHRRPGPAHGGPPAPRRHADAGQGLRGAQEVRGGRRAGRAGVRAQEEGGRRLPRQRRDARRTGDARLQRQAKGGVEGRLR